MPTKAGADTERAVFTDAHKRDLRPRWSLFLLLLGLLGLSYWVARDFWYARLTRSYVQQVFNSIANASIEGMRDFTIDRQGDLTILDGEVYTHHKGEKRLFFRAAEVRVTLDGMPLRDAGISVMRVDLFRPEIFIRREPGGDWNLLWAFDHPARPEPEQEDDPWKYYSRPDESWPRNGVHIHNGIVHATLLTASGKEITWSATQVNAAVLKKDGVLRVSPATADFYGGRVKVFGEIPKTRPFTIDQLTVDIRDADVGKMVAGSQFVRSPMTGRLNAVFAATVDKDRTGLRPILSGHLEVTQGSLWEFPVFAGLLNYLSLTAVTERRIDTAILEFTIEEEDVRIDKMYFLGHPISLFGDGRCGLAGEWINVVFVPRLGKSTWDSILPIIGTPIQWLSDIVKGKLMPVVLTGSFEHPVFAIDPLHFLKPKIRDLIEEKSPQ